MTDQRKHAKAQPGLVALFVSDIHLRASLPKTAMAFFDFLNRYGSQAEQLFLLGDLFEYWAGDDAMAMPFNSDIVAALRAVSDAGTRVYWIAGNRDFLVGEQFAMATGATLLPDPSTVVIANQKIVLAHGDEQCTDDVAYIAFRNQVRQPAWRNQFLSMPLAERNAMIEGMRQDSKIEQQSKTAAIMDVSPEAISQLFSDSGAAIMIHGHTHRPAIHQHVQGTRYVLPDWECDIEAVHGGWLGLYDDGSFVRFDVNGIPLIA
ncbi:UDP-2,3-diacylglucosamine diphosphatase [Undibacterium sp. Jales W-56]|uniref:UDP-2,3-diacylglucosamine diphosphatase n=1 Tax=Undibacterium sp. Jales W-56 TaxID=2897325 RepID=UPI0021D02F73|nr:UDP-2,3-diacylglucosamine diphosphatase [Undibacterium sp. Jales W-56]MCU6433182.1 UDP-2,3-diacylglucosamine diphosphatase [Undibacterium sp. Jales W-56]